MLYSSGERTGKGLAEGAWGMAVSRWAMGVGQGRWPLTASGAATAWLAAIANHQMLAEIFVGRQ